MSKSEKKIFTVELIMCIFFFSNIFLKNIVKDYLIISVFLVASLIIYLIAGYEKDSKINGEEQRKLLQYVCFYCIGFIIFEYGLGLLTGYALTPYKNDIFTILKNILSTTLIIFLAEHLRYMIVKKSDKNRLLLILAIIIFILADLAINVRYYDLNINIDVLEFITAVLLPSFFKNVMLTTFTSRYGLKPSLFYRLIMELYIFIIPIVPNLGLYLESVFLMIFPIMLGGIVNYGFEKSKKEEFNKNDKTINRVVVCIILLMIFGMVALNSNLFRFWMAAVGSGSMEPTINVGDAIIVDKYCQKHLDVLKEGDVLVFKIGDNIYTHRIVKIEKNNEKYRINTKGDRKGQTQDNWVVTNDDVIGVVKFKINYLGYPTVWLSRFLEDNHG